MKKTTPNTVFLTGTLTLALFLATSCSNQEQEKQSFYDKAITYIAENKTEAAILELENAVKIDPKYAEARYKLGQLYLDSGAPAKAFEEYVRTADLDPKNIDAGLKTAQFYLLSQNRDASRKYISQVLQQEPKNQEARILLANIELMEGKTEQALELVDNFGEEVKQSARLLNLQSRIYATQKEWTKAEDALKKAIAADQKNLTHYIMLLQLYEKQNKVEKAEDFLKKMAEVFPEEPQVYLLTAGYYRATRQFDHVEEALQKVVALSPNSPIPSLQLIEFYEQRGKIKTALQLARETSTKFSENKNLKVKIASLLFDQRKFDDSQKILDEVSSTDENAPDTRLLKARFLLKNEKYQDSIDILQKLTQDYPKWAAPFYYQAITHISQGELQQAETAIASALDLNKSETKYFTFMAQLQQNKRNFKEAGDSAIMALQLNPQNIRAAMILGQALIGQRKYKEARSILTQIEKIAPKDVTLLESLAIASLGSKETKVGEKYLNELLVVDPGHNRGIALYLALKFPKDIKGATAFIKSQLKKAPQDFRLHLILANLLSRQGQEQEALTLLHAAQEKEPNNQESYLAIARIFSTLDQKDQALAQYQQLLKLQPQSIPATMGCAAIFETQGDSQKAMEYYDRVLQTAPDYAPAANNMAWLIANQENGDLGRALQLAMVAKQAFPNNPKITDTLGWVHFKRQSYSLAIEQFKLGLEKTPKDPTLSYHLARAYDANGEREKAVQTLTEIDLEKNAKIKKKVEELQESWK